MLPRTTSQEFSRELQLTATDSSIRQQGAVRSLVDCGAPHTSMFRACVSFSNRTLSGTSVASTLPDLAEEEHPRGVHGISITQSIIAEFEKARHLFRNWNMNSACKRIVKARITDRGGNLSSQWKFRRTLQQSWGYVFREIEFEFIRIQFRQFGFSKSSQIQIQ